MTPTEAAIRRDERARIADELLAWAHAGSGTAADQALRHAALRVAPESSEEEMRTALVRMLDGMAARRVPATQKGSDGG